MNLAIACLGANSDYDGADVSTDGMKSIEPFNPVEFRQMGALDAWKKYDGPLTCGKGQCLAVLDDGCNFTIPEWQAELPWGRKVIATWNTIERNENAAHVPPGYHGTDVAFPSSLNYNGKCGL